MNEKVKNNSTLTRNSGFTLIEMVIYIALLGIIIGMIFNMILLVYEMNRKITSYSNVTADAESAAERIAYEVTNSKYLYLPTSNFINYNHDASKGGQLSVATANYMTANDEISFRDFYVEGGTLFMKKDGESSPVPLTSGSVSVSGFDLDYFMNGKRESVRVDLEVQSTIEPTTSINLINTITIR